MKPYQWLIDLIIDSNLERFLPQKLPMCRCTDYEYQDLDENEIVKKNLDDVRALISATTIAWIPCPYCEDYWCIIHEKHAFECDCPDLEECEAQGWNPYLQLPPDFIKVEND